MSLLNALQNTTTPHHWPYPYWIVDRPASNDVLAEVVNTPIPDGVRAYDGTRAADNGGNGLDGKLRCYVTRDNTHEFPCIASQLIRDLMDPQTVAWFETALQRDLSAAYLRVEVIADRKGFWLKPHKDIKEKLMSMLIYVNMCGEAENLGTDIYDEDLKVVNTIPYRNNLGYLFAPGHNTWHGLEPKVIRKERRSILINYVTFETCWKLSDARQSRRAA